ncbi:MAG TPA: SURF1 family protein [Candidatus Eisenbacteria bacterium]|jgi:surfeit locus 1 family protein
MKVRSILVGLLITLGAALCVRLGFWQLSRWHEKQAINAAVRAAIAAPPILLAAEPAAPEQVRDRRIEAHGRFDESLQILLGARPRDGAPGIEVVTPLKLDGGQAAVLVNRGWLYSADAATARPQEYPEPGDLRIRGLAEPLPRGLGGPAVRVLERDSVTLYSARWLDRDTLARLMPYPIAPYVLRQTPGPGVPSQPVRRLPRPANEAMHLSYAVQWFVFAVILVVGSCALAWSRGRRSAAPDPT